ncbi:MAG: hypothetical protein ACO3FO_04725 [Candidatus Nanopelagicaceae bacterium]
MPKKKKVEKEKAERAQRAVKKTEAQKTAAKEIKKLKKPDTAPKTEPKRDIKVGGEQTTPTGKFKAVEQVPPQIREAYRKRFEEVQTAEIGGEIPAERKRKYAEEIGALGSSGSPEEIKKVRGETSISESERPLTPKPKPEAEPTPGQQAKRQKGRLPRGAGRTGTFTFQTATREEAGPGIKAIRDIARQSQKGRDISPLAPHEQGTALALARRDHEIAKSTGKPVNGIDPNSETPTPYSIRGTHHERLAQVIHGYGAKEEDFAKLPGKGNLPTKIQFAWSALKEHERSKRKTPLYPDSEGATHWEDPRTKRVAPTAAGNHPEFYRHEGQTQSLIKGTGDSAWKAVTPTTQGWHVINLRGQKTWTFRGHPAEPYKDTHQVRSLFQHIQNTIKGDFPEAPITTGTDSADSRRRTAERVREKFVVTQPEPSEAAGFSKRAVKEGGFMRQRGRSQRTMVAAPDNVTVTETPETEFVTGPKRIEPRRPKVVQEPSGRRVIRPRRRDEGKKVGYITQPLTVPQTRKKGFDFETLKPVSVKGKLGPSGEILRSAPTIEKGAKIQVEKKLKTKSKIKVVPTYKVKPGLVDQPLPGMEKYGYEKQEVPAKTSTRKKLISVEGPITAGQAEAEKVVPYRSSVGELRKLVGRPFISVTEEVKTPASPAVAGSARPKEEPKSSIGETGMEQLNYIKKQYGGVIPSSSRELVKAPKNIRAPKKPKVEQKTIMSGTESELAATRNIPQQLELPGIESPGYSGAMGQQFRRVSPATRELQLKSQQGSVPGVASEMPRGTEPKKSTRSFKGRR